MKVSIITICLNSQNTLADTLQSVANQTHNDIEYIIIDGASSDNSLKIIDKYKDNITKIVSEPDQGIYDAMNKGIKLASGQIVGILNADDIFYDNQIISQVSETFKKNSACQAVYGDLVYVDRSNVNKITRRWVSGNYDKNKLKYGWIPPHPCFFVKKEVYSEYGLFNTSLQIAADYEFMLRILNKGVKPIYLNMPLVKMRNGGHSSSSIRQRMRGWKELRQAWDINKIKRPLFLITRRLISKIGQYKIL